MFTYDSNAYISSYPSIFDLSYPSTPKAETYPQDYSTNVYSSFEDYACNPYDNQLYC